MTPTDPEQDCCACLQAGSRGVEQTLPGHGYAVAREGADRECLGRGGAVYREGEGPGGVVEEWRGLSRACIARTSTEQYLGVR